LIRIVRGANAPKSPQLTTCLPARVPDGKVFNMSDKNVVLEAVRQMPEAATLDEISEEIAILAAIRRGEEAADKGRVIPHEEIRKQLPSWITK
jgi:predicted transcriptional regulator